MFTIHSCPLCDLRFEHLTEVEWHLARDHDRNWGPAERHPATAPPSRLVTPHLPA